MGDAKRKEESAKARSWSGRMKMRQVVMIRVEEKGEVTIYEVGVKGRN